jgi:proline iminopeptidase
MKLWIPPLPFLRLIPHSGFLFSLSWTIIAPLCAVEPGKIISQSEIREGYVTVTGGKVWYRIVGAGKPGVPLLALHGGPGGTSDSFDSLAPLADERPVVVYDQLGSGLSDRPSEDSLYTVERYVEELAQVRAALGLTHIHLLGHSWGTMLAVDYILTKGPDGIQSLILSGPCLSMKRWIADQRAYLAQMPRDLQEAVARNEAAGTYDSAEYTAAIRAYYRVHLVRTDVWQLTARKQTFGKDVYRFMWGPSEFTCTGTLKTYERADRLNEIHLPTFFACGQYDEATPESTAYYQSKLPGSELKVFPGASHMTYLEQPEAYCSAVRDFLHQVEAR